MARQLKFRELLRLQTPMGENSLKSLKMHRFRSMYKKLHKNKDNTIDFWYNDTLYGRIDKEGNAIYPLQSYLKQVSIDEGIQNTINKLTVGTTSTPDLVLALNFVVDAYEMFVSDFVMQNKDNPAFAEEKYLNPNGFAAKKGWENVLRLHHSLVDLTYETFFGQYLQNDLSRSRRITSFDTFVKAFLEFLELVGTKSPLTRTAMITSLYCTPNISGLCIELSDANHSHDYDKHNYFFKSVFYKSYKRTSEKYGFLIDKNAPWRLVADINSPKMQTFMHRYGVTADNLFEKYYVKSYVYDIPTLRVYLKQFYESFIASQPSVRFPDETRLERSQLSKAEFNSRYNTNYWLWLYAKIRQTEVINKLSDAEFSDIVDEAKNIKKYLDIHKAVRYINNKFLGELEPPFKK